MSFEDFQLISGTLIDTSIIERDYMIKYHHQGAHLNDSNQDKDFFFCEINNYRQIGNGYLEFDITLRKNSSEFNKLDGDGNADEHIRFLNNAFAYALSTATLSTTAGEKLDQNKYVGRVSTSMRLLTNKHGDLLTYFDKIDESRNGIKDSSLNKIPIDKHQKVADRGKAEGQLPYKQIFGFCKAIRKLQKI